MDPYQQRPADVLTGLGSDERSGLSTIQARERHLRCGNNELTTEPPVPGWRKFLAQFADVLVVLLILAGVVSVAMWIYNRDSALPYEAFAIFAIVFINAGMGYVQQARAERAVAALRQMSAAQAKVLRDGRRQAIPAAELVPGDIILVEEGDTIPADGRLITSSALQTAESALTGESLPVSKTVAAITGEVELGDRVNMVFSGTSAVYGHGRAVVTATGMRTEIGRIAGLLEQAKVETTPLQLQLDRVGRMLAAAVVGIAIVMIGTIFLTEDVRGWPAVFDAVILGVALAVAAVPEGLPAVVTAVLSLGVQQMARRNAIIRHLAAVETLGSATVIASDKTGTLTKNEMTVRLVVTASGRVTFGGTGYAPEGQVSHGGAGAMDGALRSELECALTAAERANNAVLQEHDGRWTVHGDPTEGALIVAARKAGLEALDARFERIAELPFSSERKRMTTLHRDAARPGQMLLLCKGAPDVLLARCSRELVGENPRPLTPARRAAIQNANEDLAGEALRTIGVAFRVLPIASGRPGAIDEAAEADLTFLGLIGMIDPPRDEARQAVARARSAGIRPIMITGDHPRTASVIAAELGIAGDGRVVTGVALETMSDASLDRAVREVSVYARVNPEHKLRIVKALQRNGMTVAMTGDGVNDAPALKTADIGVAMGIAGTDVSKEAADMVLADDNFASIVAAVEVGRAIYANIRKFLRYLLSSNIGEVLTMFFGVLFAGGMGLTASADGLVLPLTATQILWINLVTDGAPALALGVDPVDMAVMRLPPRARDEPIITRRMWGGIVFVGGVMALCTLAVLDAALPGGFIEGSGSTVYAQTMAFTTLMLLQLFNAFNARSEEQSAFTGMFRNRWLWAAVGMSLMLHAGAIYVPFLQQAFSTTALTPADWAICLAVASSVLWVREIGKAVTRARDRRMAAR